MKNIYTLIFSIFFFNNIYAENIEIKEDIQLAKDIEKEYLDETFYGLRCDNSNYKVNRLNCLIGNVFDVIYDNNIKFDLLPSINLETNKEWTPTLDDKIKILKDKIDNKNLYHYSNRKILNACIFTEEKTGKQILQLKILSRSWYFYDFFLYINLYKLDNDLYEIKEAFVK